MGKRGPQPTPEALNELRGHPGKRPVKGGSRLPDGDVICPDWLGEIGTAKWQELVGKLSPVSGLLKPAFEDVLAMYCEAFEEFMEARQEVEHDGPTCSSDKGGMYQHPAVGRKNQAIKRMRQIGALFGMSPVSESELPGGSAGVAADHDPLISLLQSRSRN